MDGDSQQLDLIAAGIGFTVGVASLLFPRALLRAYGVDTAQITGTGLLGWRLFAIRNLAIAGSALSGDRKARDAVLAIQGLDFLIFALAYKTRSVPRPAAVLAMLTAGLVASLGIAARARS